jgi:hypothetical protein
MLCSLQGVRKAEFAHNIRPGSTTFSIGKGIKVADRAQWERRANVVSFSNRFPVVLNV